MGKLVGGQECITSDPGELPPTGDSIDTSSGCGLGGGNGLSKALSAVEEVKVTTHAGALEMKFRNTASDLSHAHGTKAPSTRRDAPTSS